jgi:hypothetical protein
MFRSFGQHPAAASTGSNSPPPSLRTGQSVLSHSSNARRPQLSHSQTVSSHPSSHKQSSKSRPTHSGSFLTSIFTTFTATVSGDGDHGSVGSSSSSLKTHRSEVELRRDYLSPEREKEIGEIWETFKRQSQEIEEDKMTSFPCISEYEYEDKEE